MGKRYTSVTHARLRNNCSSLINDLFRNHVCDSPLCDLCGVIEDATHYFFHCINYFDEIQVYNDTDRVFQPLTIIFLTLLNLVIDLLFLYFCIYLFLIFL